MSDRVTMVVRRDPEQQVRELIRECSLDTLALLIESKDLPLSALQAMVTRVRDELGILRKEMVLTHTKGAPTQKAREKRRAALRNGRPAARKMAARLESTD